MFLGNSDSLTYVMTLAIGAVRILGGAIVSIALGAMLSVIEGIE